MTTATRPAWRCEGCGKIANSLARPRSHRRKGAACGPFVAAVVGGEGAVLAPAGATITPAREVLHGEVLDPALRYRTTTLRQFATGCPRSTVLSSKLTTGGFGSSGHRGSLLHAGIAEILRTLWRALEPRFERTEEAVVILREAAAKGPWVVTASDMFGVRNADGTIAQSGLVQMIGSVAQEVWPTSRFLIIEGAPPPFASEGRMTAEVVCPDGEIRTLSGAPDLVIADPPSTAIVVDHKQSMARPQMPREAVPEGEPIRGVQYLTDPQADYFQLCCYAVLVMTAYPAVKTVIGRERNWRWMGPWREVTIRREDLEHILPYLGTVMMQLDEALREGEASKFMEPRAGKQCLTRCSVKRSCPIAAEERGLGALDSPEAADAEGERWEVIKALHPDMRDALKAYVAVPGNAPPKLPDGRVIRWDGEKPNRKFGAFPPPEPVDPAEIEAADAALMAQWAAELEVQQAKAGAAA